MYELLIGISICIGLIALYGIGYTKGQNDAYDNIIEKLSEDK